jgi:hypothetical protein
LTSPEAKVEFKPIEPRDSRVDVRRFEFRRQVFALRPQLVGVGSIVVRHDDCVGVDPHVSFQSGKVSLGQVLRVPDRSG